MYFPKETIIKISSFSFFEFILELCEDYRFLVTYKNKKVKKILFKENNIFLIVFDNDDLKEIKMNETITQINKFLPLTKKYIDTFIDKKGNNHSFITLLK